jgi:hypothetical protein
MNDKITYTRDEMIEALKNAYPGGMVDMHGFVVAGWCSGPEDKEDFAEWCAAVDDAQIQSWKDQLPADLTYGTFEEDFEIDGIHYEHGAWGRDGNYWLAWNTDEEFKSQFVEIEITA